MQVKAVSLLVLAVALAGGTATMAQDKAPGTTEQPSTGTARREHRRPHSAADRLSRLDRRLGLTEDQKTKIGPVLQNEEQQRRAIRTNASLTREQKMEKMKALRQSTRSQVEQLLTPEQRAKLGARGKRGEGWHNRQDKPSAAPPQT